MDWLPLDIHSQQFPHAFQELFHFAKGVGVSQAGAHRATVQGTEKAMGAGGAVQPSAHGDVPAGEGVSRLVVEHCDQKVSLPMAGHIDSLNASVAAGIMMYRVLSSRKA
jgi:hypothetical protein